MIKTIIRSLTALFIAITFLTDLKAQDLVPSDTLNGWDVNWVANLNGSQASYSNWAKGGVNNLSVVAGSQFTSLYRKDAFSYGLRFQTRYGQSRIQDEGVRKTDDRISIRNRFLYDLGEDHVDFSIFTNINFETQFGRGFNYGAGPDGTDILISSFMSPAYFTQNAGLAYVPGDTFAIEAGLGMKQTIVSDTTLSTRYGLDPGKRLHNEAGFTFGMSYSKEIWENVVYTGYVETFSNVNRALRRTDVNFSNQLIGRINNNLNMSLQFEMIYDDDFSRGIQISQVLSAGLSVILY